MKNSLLARGCGFVTVWILVADTPLLGDYLLWIDPAPLTRNAAIVKVASDADGAAPRFTHASLVDRGRAFRQDDQLRPGAAEL